MVIKHFFTLQFIKFIGVGATAALLHWLARIILSQSMPFSWAVVWAYGVGMFIAFVLNAIFVFPNSDKATLSQMRDFVLVNLAFFPVVWALSLSFKKGLEYLGLTVYSEAIAHGLAISVPMLATFLIYKFFAFKENSGTK